MSVPVSVLVIQICPLPSRPSESRRTDEGQVVSPERLAEAPARRGGKGGRWEGENVKGGGA